VAIGWLKSGHVFYYLDSEFGAPSTGRFKAIFAEVFPKNSGIAFPDSSRSAAVFSLGH